MFIGQKDFLERESVTSFSQAGDTKYLFREKGDVMLKGEFDVHPVLTHGDCKQGK